MSGIDHLVERQMRNWEILRAQRSQRAPEAATPGGPVEDFITISRAVGTGGGEIAALLARRLNWPVFDKEVLDAMSGDDSVRRQIYQSMDERDLGWFEEAIRSLGQTGFVKNDYFHNMSATILSLARQGHGVFLGRGADLVLPATSGVRVQLVAPSEARAQRIATEGNLDLDRARELMMCVDTERAEFIHRRFQTCADDPGRFDLTINTCSFAADQIVSLIMNAFACRSSERTILDATSTSAGSSQSCEP